MANELFEWCLRNKAFGATLGLSHLMQDARRGKLYVKENVEPEFLRQYAQDIEAGVKHYVVEMRTPIFKLAVDICIPNLPDAHVVDYARLYQRMVRKFYFSTDEKIL